MLELPLLVRAGVFLFVIFYLPLRADFFGAFFAPFPKEEILDYQAQGQTIQVFTVTTTEGLKGLASTASDYKYNLFRT